MSGHVRNRTAAAACCADHFRRRPILLSILVLGLWLLTGAVFPQPGLCQPLPDRFVVRKVTLAGVDRISEKALRKTLAARPRPFWRFWEPEEPITGLDLTDDAERIRQFYRARGFYHSRVSSEAETTGAYAQNVSGEGKEPLPVVRATFFVQEGPPVRVSEIRIDPGDGPSLGEILDAIPLKEGGIFATQDYRAAKKALARLYGNRGYPFAKVDGQVRVDVRENVARVALDVTPGRAYRFGAVKILQEGVTVREEIVRRALQFAAGDPYRTSAVEQSQRNLVNLNVFRSALIVPGEPAESSDLLPMEVRLRTKEPRQVGIGIGYGSEDGLRLRAAWAYRNLMERAGRFTLSARRTDLVENVQAEYLQPYWLDDRTDLRLRTGWEREDLESYTNDKTFANASVSRRLSPVWGATLGYKLESNRIEEIRLLDPTEVQELVQNNQYLVSAVKIGVTRRTVDDVLYPTDGTEISLASEAASGLAGSELKYVRPAAEVKAYHTFAAPVTLAGRVKLETIEGIEDTDFIPIPERLFLGGSNTVRGYGYQMLGPLDAGGNPRGGRSAANANLEGRFPIYRSFSGIVFFDAGVVDPDAFSFDPGKIRTSCGAGFRYDTPIGPLGVEVGYKLNPKEEELPPGVEAEERWRIHFSIGQTF